MSKGMTDEERLALAAKLDKELDDFIDGLEKKRYTEGWPEDRWEEEMDKHPFFMKQVPGAGEAVSPLVEGLQRLKYDPEENTAAELAINYKEDGNFNFKHKNYRMAVISYTEGLKAKCEDPEINASLYNNRSASQFFLKNYRSCLNDCKKAISLQPSHLKALLRAAECCVELAEFELCQEYCDRILLQQPDHEKALNFKKESAKRKEVLERDHRKKEHLERKKRKDEDDLLLAVKSRGYQLTCMDDVPAFTDLQPIHYGAPRVRWDKQKTELVWPVLFMYPEYHILDLIPDFHETSVFKDYLHQMFENHPEWDSEKKYKPDALNLYYEGSFRKQIYPVNIDSSLMEVMIGKHFRIKTGTPTFHVLVKGSKAENDFKEEYKK